MLLPITFTLILNLTSPRPYDVQHYRVEVKVRDAGQFEATSTLTINPTRQISSIELDAYGLNIISVRMANKRVPFTLQENQATESGILKLQFAQPVTAKKTFDIAIKYSGSARASHEGFFKVPNQEVENAPPYFFTHFQPHRAQLFLPNNQEPSDKATSEILAEVDSRYTVLSNGEKVLDALFDEGSVKRRRVHWKQTKPHSAYLIALAIGEFEDVELKSRVSARIWVPQGKAPLTEFAAEYTPFALRFQEEYLGVPYPWHKFDQVAVPRFIWGGMENTSLVFNRENGLIAEGNGLGDARSRISGLIAHELAHQWFGDYVTCRSWADTWLNEGFATYLSRKTDAEFYKNDFVDTRMAVSTFVEYFQHEEGPRAKPLAGRTDSPQEAFDAVTYIKGAHVLRMLEALLGEQEFRRALKAYLEKYALGAATSRDFFKTVAQVTKRPLEVKAFERSWLYKKGYPLLSTRWTYENQEVILEINQTPSHVDEKGPFYFQLPVVIHGKNEPRYEVTEWLTISRPKMQFRMEVPDEPAWVNWNAKGAALARIDMSRIPESEKILASQFETDAVWRLLSLWALSSEKPLTTSSRSVAAVAEALGSATVSPFVREALLNRLSNRKEHSLPTEWTKAVFRLAQPPDSLVNEDSARSRLRKSALSALGKFKTPEIRRFLFAGLRQPRTDLNTLSGLALGTAKLGDAQALAELNAAFRIHEGRGYPYFRVLAESVGGFESTDALPVIESILSQDASNSELTRGILSKLQDNSTVKASRELCLWVKRYVLEKTTASEELKSRVLKLLDDVTTSEARAALQEVARKSQNERLRKIAEDTLKRHFVESKPLQPNQ